MLTFPKVVYKNKFGLPDLAPLGTFKGQTILITGATGGLGLAAAAHFINLGAATVIITGRTAARGQTAKAEIERQRLDWHNWQRCVKKEVKSIDYVLLNAGMFPASLRLGKEEFEESIEIKEAGKGSAHLSVVTSGLHRGIDISPGKFPQQDILTYWNKAENFNKGTMYAINKLLVQYCVREIAKLAVSPDGTPQVIVNPMCPGMVKSDLGREYKTNFLISAGVDAFMNLAMKSTEGGARTLLLAALTTKAENGKHFTNYQSDEDYLK
ncbi:related to alcohol dehydrogenase homolog Bli-4 [Phialocephala subalpina]|uniref:Related to alcohol dehydrogenase homolog Bli-4 n=1 Tax=Phialocephala subalpina TaxID=576137 RepID=A0A1L7WKG6_9HELO|nr:related to alcohol dehydrogenase homolog Bli-4 [Phialocephala subalpina]